MGVLVRVGALVQLEHTMAVRAAGSSTKNLIDHFRDVVFLLSMEILLFKDETLKLLSKAAAEEGV